MATLASEIPTARLVDADELSGFIHMEGAISVDDMWTATLRSGCEDGHDPESRDWVQIGDHPTGETGFSHVDKWGYPSHWERGDSWDYFVCAVEDGQAVVDAGGIENIINDALHGIRGLQRPTTTKQYRNDVPQRF